MRKRTIKLVGMIALFFMALSMIGNWIISWSMSSLTEENTTLFTATVEEVRVMGAADDVAVTILVKEYPTGLLLFNSRAAAVPQTVSGHCTRGSGSGSGWKTSWRRTWSRSGGRKRPLCISAR